MSCVQDNGYISAPSGLDRMYGHGFATLFLAEAYGMSQRRDVGEKLRKAAMASIGGSMVYMERTELTWNGDDK